MSWNDLPQELEEKILSHLALVELADLSSTRKVFLAAFRKQLATEQKALCDTAIARYGHERIKLFAELCTCFLTEGTVSEDLARRKRQLPREGWPDRGVQGSADTCISVQSYNGGPLHAEFRLGLRYMHGLADLGWVAFLQAVLSVGMSTSAPRVQIRCHSDPFREPFTLAGLKAHIAPLLPLVAGCMFTGWGRGITVKGSMHVGELGPDEKGIRITLVFYS